MRRPTRHIDENGHIANWPALLSPRLRQIAKLRAMDVSHREIAHRLGIQPGTVATHVHRIYLILKAHSVDELRLRMDW